MHLLVKISHLEMASVFHYVIYSFTHPSLQLELAEHTLYN
jgi:hypothetical protein